ncbi:MAG: PqqD family protein [Gemmatimonadaceae bacterium]|nr:PqqD family protein [Gemmatimonadaceae bacterium]
MLMDVIRGRYYTLNTVGARIWHLLASWTTVDAIIACLYREFDVSLEVLHTDVVAIMLQLDRSALLTLD